MDQNKTQQTAGAASRRDFLKRATAASAVVTTANLFKTPVYGQAPSANVVGANNRIVVAHIGVGGQGQAHVRDMTKAARENNTAHVAICDVSKSRITQASDIVRRAGLGDPEGYADYRKVLERKDIDAVVVATVDHWHTRCSVDAMNAGKHVYVEKPMTRYLGEAFEIYDTVKKTGKILQVGSQGCSDKKWHKAAELIRAGGIGPVVMAQGSYMRNNPKGEWNYPILGWCTPEDLDWKAWLGSQIKKQVPFSNDHYFRWRKYYPYCAGLLGDLFPHKLHPYMLATGNPEFPSRVAAIGNQKVQTDKNTPGTPVRDVPEIVQLIAEFPSGMVMHITSSSVNEVGTQEMIRGHKATLTMGSNRVELKPERPFVEEIDPFTSETFPGETLVAHERNWLDSIRANQQPNAGIELAVRVQTVISLAEISERLNAMVMFDEKTRKVTDYTGKEITPLTYGTLELS